MITPRLFRRSLATAGQWRLLLLAWGASLLPALLAAFPLFRLLAKALDRSTRASQSVAFLDGRTLLELLRQLSQPQSSTMPVGLVSGLLVALAISPALAGAVLTAARADEPLPLPDLLAGAGRFLGRLARLSLLGLLVLGAAGALAALAFKLAGDAGAKTVWATQANRQTLAALAASAVLVWLAHLLLDAGRAVLAAQPGRRSAFLAFCAGVRLVFRQPVRALALGLLGSAAGLVLAGAIMLARLRLEQRSAGRVALAWALAQAAVLAIAWGKGTQLCGLADLARADFAHRARPVILPPPPAPIIEAAPQQPAEPPAQDVAALSPPGASDT